MGIVGHVLNSKVMTADGFVWCLDQKPWSFRTSGMKAKIGFFFLLSKRSISPLPKTYYKRNHESTRSKILKGALGQVCNAVFEGP